MRALVAPWRRHHALTDVDPQALREEGVRLVLLDRDNTCVPRDVAEPPAEVVEWVARARDAGLALTLVSNNCHSHDLARTASTLGIPFVGFALKPAPFGLWRAMDLAGVAAEQTVLVGDQLFTDILGGRTAGVRVVLVDPQSTCDLPYTLVLRRLESRLLRDIPYDAPVARPRGASE